MRTPEDEPSQKDIESFLTDEERRALEDPTVPEDVKSEIAERLERFREQEIEQIQAEDSQG
ncbi:MAG TPA: hypothetical protein VKT72_14995 [Candidatus Baltobacteraceae bacterium]|nr:hypothetical protein [Candidatus Baltobacteraceae bacterium]